MEKHKERKIKCCKKKINVIIIAVLAILLVSAFSYIGIERYNEKKNEENMNIFKNGAQYGYEQAIIEIANIAVKCEAVPLNIRNNTINMIAVDCLKQQAQ